MCRFLFLNKICIVTTSDNNIFLYCQFQYIEQKHSKLAAEIMSGEPDSGTGPGGSGVKLEPPINNNNNEDTECDKVTASNTNFESKDGLKILQCERCGEFETISLALLLVHVAQCNPANRGEAENHNDTNSNDQPPPTEANKQSRKLFEVRQILVTNCGRNFL